MARRSRGFAPLRQGQRRKTVWVASADVTAVTALGGATALLAQTFTGASLLASGLIPSTVIRVRGELYVQSDQTAVAERPFGAMGFAVVTDQASAAGIASVPAPITDESSDSFFVWQPWQAAAIVDSAAVAIQPMERFTFDSKAMRKIEEGSGMVVTLENAALAGIGAQFILKFRLLLKLS